MVRVNLLDKMVSKDARIEQGALWFSVIMSLYLAAKTLTNTSSGSDPATDFSFLPYAATGLLIPIATMLFLVAFGMLQSRKTLPILMTIPLTIFSFIALGLFSIPLFLIWMTHIGFLTTLALCLFVVYKIYYTSTNIHGFHLDVASFFVALMIIYFLNLVITFFPSISSATTIVLFPVINILSDALFSKARKRQAALFNYFVFKR